MTTIKLSVTADIEGAIQEAIENVGLTGMGVDGTSEYEISDMSVMQQDDGSYEVIVIADRVEGKFVGKDEIAELISGEIDQLEVQAQVDLV